MDYSEVFKSTFALFAVIALGYFSRKKNILTDQTSSEFSRFVVRILLPIYLFRAASTYMTHDYLRQIPFFCLSNVVLMAVLFFVSLLVSRVVKIHPEREPAFQLSAIVGNTGFIGLSFANAFFGPEGVIAATLFDFGGSLIFFTLIIPFVLEGKSGKGIMQLIKQPIIIAEALGIFCGVIGFRIPAFVIPAFDLVSSVTLPLALLLCGVQLAGISTFRGHKFWQASYVVLIKMILSPMVMLGFVQFLPINHDMKRLLVLLAAMPTGISLVNFARTYGQDSDFTAISIFATTLLSMIWLPLLMIGLDKIY